MARRVVFANGIDGLHRLLQDLNAQATLACLSGIKQGALEGVYVLRRAVEDAVPAYGSRLWGAVASKNYLNGWQAWLPADGTARVANFTGWPALVVESGRGAGKRPPPLHAIQAWYLSRFGVTPPKAFILRHSWDIGSRGLRARNVMGGSVEKVADKALDAVEREIDDLLARL